MICPICNSPVPEDSKSCPTCGASVPVLEPDAPVHEPSFDAAAEFIFCEGCGARLSPQDRTCPKCGRPAPGILSQDSAAADLAAGKTASFPRLTSEMIAGAIPAPGDGPLPEFPSVGFDEDATSVMNADDLSAASDAGARPVQARSAVRHAVSHEEVEDGKDPYAKPRRARWVALAASLALVAGGVWFAAVDPMGVMPGLYESFGKAASEMFPSRQLPEDGAVAAAPGEGEKDEDSSGREQVSDSVLSEAEAYQRLSAMYGQILELEDQIGPVVETYNGQYLVKDHAQRQAAAQSAYDLAKSLEGVIAELDGLELGDDTAYAEDVDHLRQLATWTFNRVDVLCRSWDINLALGEGERPLDHQDEILAPLREVEQVNGKSIDVVQYEENVGAWKPVEK